MIAVSKSTRPLGEVAKVISGYAFKSAEFIGEGVPVIKIKNIRVGTVDLDDAAYVDERFLKLDSKFHVNPGDLLISLTGSHPNQPNSVVGRVARMGSYQTRCLLNQRAGKIYLRKGAEGDLGYLYYVLSSPGFRNAVAMLANGAASQANVSPTQVESLEIPFPDLPTQRKIAGILSAYDDLIENNLRRIKLLEEMAQSLYREWFVHFRFPGHESVKFVESELGQIPEGWEVVPMGDFVQFKSGFAFKSSKFVDDGEHRLVTIKNVQDGVFNPVSDSILNELPEKLPSYSILEDGDILLSLTGNVGRVCLVYDGPFLLNQRVAKLSPVNSFDWMLVYCVFRSAEMRTALEMLSNGVAQQNLSPVQAAKIDFPLPPEILRKRFASIAEPIGHHVVQLYNANQNLRRTRDLLLPKLLSNENR